MVTDFVYAQMILNESRWVDRRLGTLTKYWCMLMLVSSPCKCLVHLGDIALLMPWEPWQVGFPSCLGKTSLAMPFPPWR